MGFFVLFFVFASIIIMFYEIKLLVFCKTKTKNVTTNNMHTVPDIKQIKFTCSIHALQLNSVCYLSIFIVRDKGIIQFIMFIV